MGGMASAQSCLLGLLSTQHAVRGCIPFANSVNLPLIPVEPDEVCQLEISPRCLC